MGRKLSKKISARLAAHEQLLLTHAAKEWELTQKQARREEIVRRSKDAAVVVGKNLLKLAAIGGVLLAGPIGASIVGIAATGFSRQRAFYDKRAFNYSRRYLRDRGLLTLQAKGNGVYTVTLTSKGKRRALSDIFHDFTLQKPEKWDGYWRVVSFDIANRKKRQRDGFRAKLKAMRFYPLQESLFVTPYPCDDEIAFLIDAFDIGRGVHVMKVQQQHMGDDEVLRRFFNM